MPASQAKLDGFEIEAAHAEKTIRQLKVDLDQAEKRLAEIHRQRAEYVAEWEPQSGD